MGARRRAATLAAAVLLSACGGPGLDAEQVDVERRTCASLRERVAARSLSRFGIPTELDPEDKVDDLDPRVLATLPDRWFATMEQELAAAPFGAVQEPTTRSPASRMVGTCRDLGS